MKKKNGKNLVNLNQLQMSVFYDGYRERNPIEWVKRFIRHWKWAWQRATRGYCDSDVWNIYAWFLSVMPAMLDQMADEAHGCPATMPSANSVNSKALMLDDEEKEDKDYLRWKEILHTMAQKFRDADEEETSMKNPYEEDWRRAYDEFESQYGFLGKKLEQEAVKQKAPSIRAHFPDEFPQSTNSATSNRACG